MTRRDENTPDFGDVVAADTTTVYKKKPPKFVQITSGILVGDFYALDEEGVVWSLCSFGGRRVWQKMPMERADD